VLLTLEIDWNGASFLYKLNNTVPNELSVDADNEPFGNPQVVSDIVLKLTQELADET
jgi:hypothetical protein